LPILQILLKPQFVEGSKTKILDNDGNVVYDGEKSSTINMGLFTNKDHLNDAIRLLHDNDLHESKILQLKKEFPILCPVCDKEGVPVCRLDWRQRTKKFVDRNTPIQIHYYHGHKPHYIGTLRGNEIHPTPRISDTRKLHPRWKIISRIT
jgi:hypothetical protein